VAIIASTKSTQSRSPLVSSSYARDPYYDLFDPAIFIRGDFLRSARTCRIPQLAQTCLQHQHSPTPKTGANVLPR
jgi:hypothetical protein